MARKGFDRRAMASGFKPTGLNSTTENIYHLKKDGEGGI